MKEMKETKKLKIAQIGTGHDHATAAIRTLKEQSDLYELTGFAVVPGDEEVFTQTQQVYDGICRKTADEILNDPSLDAVCIETEDRRLTEYAIRAAERGLPMHMDKPGSASDADFDRLMDLVEEKQLPFQTGYMYRYNPAVVQLMEDIRAGRLGEIYSVEAQMNCLHTVEKRNWLGNYPGGMLYFLGCHLIDLIYAIQGEPEEILPMSMPSGLDGVTADDFGMVVFRYRSGISFAKSTAVEYGGFERRQLVVCGSKGTVELRPFEWLDQDAKVFSSQKTGVREAFDPGWHVRGSYHDTPSHGRYDAMFRAFAAYVKGEEKNPFSYEYERRLHKLILKSCGCTDVR